MIYRSNISRVLLFAQVFITFQPILFRYQLWPLDKKLRVVRQAKDYLDRHASEVEQRLAQDRTFKGRLQTAKLKFIKWLQVEKFDSYSLRIILQYSKVVKNI